MSEPVPAMSDAELLHWNRFCCGLFERIIEARLSGKSVCADSQPEYLVPKLNGNEWIGLPTGRQVICVVV